MKSEKKADFDAKYSKSKGGNKINLIEMAKSQSELNCSGGEECRGVCPWRAFPSVSSSWPKRLPFIHISRMPLCMCIVDSLLSQGPPPVISRRRPGAASEFVYSLVLFVSPLSCRLSWRVIKGVLINNRRIVIIYKVDHNILPEVIEKELVG